MRTIVTRTIANLEEIGAGAALLLVIGITVFNIANRYLLQRSAAWAPELAEILFAWVVFLGGSAAWKRNMHISISAFVRVLGARSRAIVDLLGEIILVAFLAYATYLAIKITISSHSRVSPVLRIPFSYVYASALLGFGLMLIRRSLILVKSLRHGSPTES